MTILSTNQRQLIARLATQGLERGDIEVIALHTLLRNVTMAPETDVVELRISRDKFHALYFALTAVLGNLEHDGATAKAQAHKTFKSIFVHSPIRSVFNAVKSIELDLVRAAGWDENAKAGTGWD